MKLKKILILLMILTIAFIVGNINEVKATSVPSFGIRVTTVDSSTGATTTNSQYSMAIPSYGVVTTYNLGSSGTDLKTGYTSNGTYTLKQLQVSSGGYDKVSDISLSVTRNNQGQITSATTNRPTSEVSVSWANGNSPLITLTIKDKKTTPTATSFGIRVTTVDSSTGSRTTNSQYSMSIPGYGAVTTYNLGSSGTDLKTGYTSNGTYTLRQTQLSSGGYDSVPDINLTVTRNAQGQITNATTNRSTSEVSVNWTNGNSPEITITIRDKKSTPTATSFGIRVTTVDSSTGSRTTNSQYSMSIPGYGTVTTYNMGSGGTDLKTGYTSNGTYTLRQTQLSSGGYDSVPDINLTVTRNAQGQITNATTNRPTSEVTVSWTNSNSPEITVTIRDKKSTPTATSFGIRVTTVDSSTGSRTTNSQYSMSIPGYGAVTTYNLGASGTDLKTGYTSNGTYTLKQTQVSSGGYDSVPDINLTVTRNAQGQITNATTNRPTSEVSVGWVNNTTPELSVTIRDKKAAPLQTSFSIGIKTTDISTSNVISGAIYRVRDPFTGSIRNFDINSSGFVSLSGFTAPASQTVVTYTFEQTRNSTNYNTFGTIAVQVTFNVQGIITNATSSNNNVSVTYTSNSVTIVTKETPATVIIPTPKNITIGLTTLNRNDKSIVTGGTYVIQPSQGNSMSYTIGSSGTASNTFTSLPAGTYTYTIRQTTPSTDCQTLGNMEIYVTYNSNGEITRVSTNSSNITGSFNSTAINLQILETKNVTTPISNGYFSLSVSTPGSSTGTLVLQGPNGDTKNLSINNGTVTISDLKVPGAGKHTYTIKNSSYITGNAADINIFISFDANGKITSVSTDSKYLSGSYNVNSISIAIKR